MTRHQELRDSRVHTWQEMEQEPNPMHFDAVRRHVGTTPLAHEMINFPRNPDFRDSKWHSH
jgi:hypothetical protein